MNAHFRETVGKKPEEILNDSTGKVLYQIEGQPITRS